VPKAEPKRIIFAGSPEFAVPALQGLVDSGHRVVAVLTQPDRPAGRGQKMRISPIKAHALGLGIEVLQPDRLSSDSEQQRLRNLQPDLMVVVAYGLILPRAILDIPEAGCINLHASLLPRWRGAAPIQSAILNGDQITGISLMKMDEGLDTGPVFSEKKIHIDPEETAGELHDRLAQLGADLLTESLEDLLNGHIAPVPQAVEGASYAGRINKRDASIDWQQTAQCIHNQIRAYNPWPVAYTMLEGEMMRCWAATLPCPKDNAANENSGNEPGTVIHTGPEGIDVQTSAGVIRLLSVQMPGRKKMTTADFLNGRNVMNMKLSQT